MKFQTLIVLFLGILIFSCSNDDDSGDHDPIIGNWKVESQFVNGKLNQLEPCRYNSTVQLKEDGTGSFVDFYGTSLDSCNGEISTFNWSNNNGAYAFSYSYDGEEYPVDGIVVTFEKENTVIAITFEDLETEEIIVLKYRKQ